MIVAVHQPNFLPWLGYFSKIANADVFVFLDDAPFSKGSYTNRVQIRCARGMQWLTVPVLTAGRLGQSIQSVKCDDSKPWRKKVVGSLQSSYGRSKHYRDYVDGVCSHIEFGYTNLVDLNVALVCHLLRVLQIDNKVVRSSSLDVSGESTDRLVEICSSLGGTTYLSGLGGLNYQLEETFTEASIELVYSTYRPVADKQRFSDFIPGLSVVDSLFNYGQSTKELLNANC